MIPNTAGGIPRTALNGVVDADREGEQDVYLLAPVIAILVIARLHWFGWALFWL